MTLSRWWGPGVLMIATASITAIAIQAAGQAGSRQQGAAEGRPPSGKEARPAAEPGQPPEVNSPFEVKGLPEPPANPLGDPVEVAPVQEPNLPETLPPELEAKLQKIESIKPKLFPPIPDNPPPHEGAMIDIPFVIEPPDLIQVEVLEALPGRPITGERLVRPDGTITLGFYGDVHVRGLTLEQARTKIILHLRTYLDDQCLGLMQSINPETAIQPEAPVPAPGAPAPPAGDEEPLKAGQPQPKPGNAASRARSIPSAPRRAMIVRRASAQQPKPSAAPGRPANAPQVQVPKLKVRGDEGAEAMAPQQAAPPVEAAAPANTNPFPGIRTIPIEQNERVFVDMTAYNSKAYYTEGDFASPGRLPITGKETVLDAINYAGGLAPTADPKNIHLIRPPQGGKPARIYPIDLAAITERGDARANLQIFPNDRIVVGRHPVVQSTIAIDRAAAPLNQVLNSVLTYSSTMRSLANIDERYTNTSDSGQRTRVGGDNANADVTPPRPPIDPARRMAILKSFAEFWAKSTRPGAPPLDEKTLNEFIIRTIQAEPQKAEPPKAQKPAPK